MNGSYSFRMVGNLNFPNRNGKVIGFKLLLNRLSFLFQPLFYLQFFFTPWLLKQQEKRIVISLKKVIRSKNAKSLSDLTPQISRKSNKNQNEILIELLTLELEINLIIYLIMLIYEFLIYKRLWYCWFY